MGPRVHFQTKVLAAWFVFFLVPFLSLDASHHSLWRRCTSHDADDLVPADNSGGPDGRDDGGTRCPREPSRDAPGSNGRDPRPRRRPSRRRRRRRRGPGRPRRRGVGGRHPPRGPGPGRPGPPNVRPRGRRPVSEKSDGHGSDEPRQRSADRRRGNCYRPSDRPLNVLERRAIDSRSRKLGMRAWLLFLPRLFFRDLTKIHKGT